MTVMGKRIELELPCTLSEEEMQSRSMMLVETVAHKDETARAKRDAAKEYGDQLVALDEKQRQLAGVLKTGIERRMVGCQVLFHTPAEATKRIVRMDTGEVVKEEAMTPAECQMHMFAAYSAFEEFMKEEAEQKDGDEPPPAPEPHDPPKRPKRPQ